MKVIGVEVRFGYDGIPYAFREAKLVPLEIVMPAISDATAHPTGEVTFHTTEGDVTFRVRLPFNPYASGQPTVGMMQASAYLDRQIEAGV